MGAPKVRNLSLQRRVSPRAVRKLADWILHLFCLLENRRLNHFNRRLGGDWIFKFGVFALYLSTCFAILKFGYFCVWRWLIRRLAKTLAFFGFEARETSLEQHRLTNHEWPESTPNMTPERNLNLGANFSINDEQASRLGESITCAYVFEFDESFPSLQHTVCYLLEFQW